MSSVSHNDILRLAQIVREETGNVVEEKNYTMLESRIQSHLLRSRIDSMEEYWRHFARNEKAERELLQSLMTTHHTFFFRESIHFEVFQNWIDSELPRLKERFEKSKKPLRVWSAACSRGQEVYTLAMFLELALAKKHGIPFEVIGTDIDPESVTFARNGVYPIKEVNTIPQMYLSGYWKRGTGEVKDFAAVHPILKARVQFDVLNLLEVPKWSQTQKFDVIFCRNVFIYFSTDNVKKIALSLADRLEPGGLFVSGVSEPLFFEGWTLTSAGPSCYRSALLNQAVGAAKKTSAHLPTPPPQLAPASMPTPPAKVAEPATPPPVPETRTVTPTTYRVLCVDDSTTIQVLIKKIFSQDPNCKGVDTAGNGREAREMLDRNKYDVVTLDIHMPVVGGIEFLERLYKKRQDPPVIMISSVNRMDVDLATHAISLGAFDYVEKPAMNDLQKSSDEILTKTRMALRAGAESVESKVSEFDSSIAKKIVVPDASQCLRILLAGPDSLVLLEQIINGQAAEYRSPATVVVWKGTPAQASIEDKLMHWSTKSVVTLRDGKQILKPNTNYVVQSENATEVLASIRAKSVSLQVLDRQTVGFGAALKGRTVQVLLDERVADFKSNLEAQLGLKVSDMTPATSFPSLSVEFFALLRKAA